MRTFPRHCTQNRLPTLVCALFIKNTASCLVKMRRLYSTVESCWSDQFCAPQQLKCGPASREIVVWAAQTALFCSVLLWELLCWRTVLSCLPVWGSSKNLTGNNTWGAAVAEAIVRIWIWNEKFWIWDEVQKFEFELGTRHSTRLYFSLVFTNCYIIGQMLTYFHILKAWKWNELLRHVSNSLSIFHSFSWFDC